MWFRCRITMCATLVNIHLAFNSECGSSSSQNVYWNKSAFMMSRQCLLRHACVRQGDMQIRQSDGCLTLFLSHYLTILNLSPSHIGSNPRISMCGLITAEQLLCRRSPISHNVWICHESKAGLSKSFSTLGGGLKWAAGMSRSFSAN